MTAASRSPITSSLSALTQRKTALFLPVTAFGIAAAVPHLYCEFSHRKINSLEPEK
jgi:hypothetical protein